MLIEHFTMRKNDCNDKLLKDEETFIMFSQNKVFFNYKINIFVVHFRDGWRGVRKSVPFVHL